ncbi:MAG: hypothetical protein IJK64_10030 [Clostridia bacterium]|nr:hypothetical protein [Clostridia bacterium]
MESKLEFEEQYRIQRKEIKQYYRKHKVIKILIAFIGAAISAIVFLLSLKKMFGDNNDVICVVSLIICAGFLAVLIRLPFFQSAAERKELEALNQAAIAARLNDREG